MTKKVLKPKTFIKSGSKEEAAELAKFRKTIDNVNGDFVDYVKNAAKLQTSRDKMNEQSSALNQYFYRQMSLACAMPLSNGVSKDAVLEAMSMRLGMMIASPEFRINSHISYSSRKMDKISEKLRDGKGNKEHLQGEYDKLYEKKYGRYPFSPESAALQEIGFTMRAYEQMRQPGANINDVLDKYQQAVNMLHGQAKQDGVSLNDINQNMRVVVGRMIEKDPSTAVYFSETAFGEVGRADYHEEIVSEMVDGHRVDRTVFRWSGEFTDSDGNPYTGGFTPREPMSETAHRDAYSDSIYSDMSACESAAEVKDYFVNTAKHGGFPDEMRREAMYQDGFTTEQVDTIRKNGMMDAICRFNEANSWFDTSRVFNRSSYERYSRVYNDFQNGVHPGDEGASDDYEP